MSAYIPANMSFDLSFNSKGRSTLRTWADTDPGWPHGVIEFVAGDIRLLHKGNIDKIKAFIAELENVVAVLETCPQPDYGPVTRHREAS